MPDKNIKVTIVSQEGSIFSSDVKHISLRGSNGDMSISHGHTQLLSTMPAGSVSIVGIDGKCEAMYVSGGIVEVQPDQVIILADVMERSQNLSKSTIEEAKQKALDILKNSESLSKIDINKANTILRESEARLKTLMSSRSLYYSEDSN